MSKALFLDRDGVINVDSGYVHEVNKFVFIDGIFDFCRFAASKGYIIIVVTNQSGIGRKLFTEEEFRVITEYMIAKFHEQGVEIADVFHCPDLEGEDRKPNPGMFLKAQAKWNIDMCDSVSVGDRYRDIEAGQLAGVGKNLLFDGNFNVLKEAL